MLSYIFFTSFFYFFFWLLLLPNESSGNFVCDRILTVCLFCPVLDGPLISCVCWLNCVCSWLPFALLQQRESTRRRSLKIYVTFLLRELFLMIKTSPVRWRKSITNLSPLPRYLEAALPLYPLHMALFVYPATPYNYDIFTGLPFLPECEMLDLGARCFSSLLT